ncbi:MULTISPECIES: nucleotidyl transferase AbiEii/AbiGii toxin family protein [unclassified Wenzhouxiangella]|uniref:nucleotidyl transferase AbiEii/AbiGii toxin family protein n=1 Tax=unclassified Wenzhouxiangella TaxID=2613841 RepID=UPI000E32548F|nr:MULTISPECIES: nucleotidyl transferase AbiEii/AbiGii toxin family protein [unclassified Wenzhouxiangella]RFF27663.1 nucleotidyl transferase AbiEii/AbiGii toxin family protein [Wenzhouxiangella sp. 15181]RFP69755.1 nucleotidyl transferase AbiEii/AbiGii toxin family protein [Wenzhouxiangella sp. 15190]
MQPDRQTIEDVAAELGVAPAFVEKDWHAVRLLDAISQRIAAPPTPVFAGGTSLSKGYGLIKRFSEDLDFRLDPASRDASDRSLWRSFRRRLVEIVGDVEGMQPNTGGLELGSSFCKLPVQYRNTFDVPESLRPHLQLEFSYRGPRREPKLREVSSLIGEVAGSTAELEISCLVPEETAADKLCALTWRVLHRNRDAINDDPTVIRHLHDLKAMLPVLEIDQCFLEDVRKAHDADNDTRKRRIGMSIGEGMRKAREKLKDDPLWREEYDQFVAGTWYGEESAKIPFEDAVSGFDHLIVLLEKGGLGVEPT